MRSHCCDHTEQCAPALARFLLTLQALLQVPDAIVILREFLIAQIFKLQDLQEEVLISVWCCAEEKTYEVMNEVQLSPAPHQGSLEFASRMPIMIYLR